MPQTAVNRIESVHELNAVRDAARKEKDRFRCEGRQTILICMGGGCIASGSIKTKEALQDALDSHGLAESVAIVETGCLGPCAAGPVVVMGNDGVFYQKVTPADAVEIVESHVIGGKIVQRLTWKEGPEGKPVPIQTDISFFKRQTKIVLRNCGLIDPTRIGDYIARDGYQALAKVLTSMSPEAVLKEMAKSGLRGRGGAGFPTWRKWSFTRESPGKTKYVLCNADEGDPGAFMDRSVLEGDPHSVIEGMAVAAHAVGAAEGYVYVRAEYPLAVERLGKAIVAARASGLLGRNILAAGFSFDVEIRMGSGAFVCGEETALIASIEGKRGEPRTRPPFPAQKGLWGKPSVLNNVETYANVPAIILKGGDWFASFGTEKSKGTKVFALAGDINNSGLVEVPVGTALGELIYDIGGGIPDGRRFKAAQIGGPSGGCVPKQHLNVPLDYESLDDLGAIMGSGGLVVMDETTCMVDVARFFLEFVQDESCGKCVPCRLGTKRMLDILNGICEGRGRPSDIDELVDLGTRIKASALCGLGQTAPNPVLSTIRHFRSEYEAHILERRCPAKKCRGLFRYEIDAEACTACGLCRKHCPADAITGEKKVPHVIDQEKCTLCGTCLDKCPSGAVLKV